MRRISNAWALWVLRAEIGFSFFFRWEVSFSEEYSVKSCQIKATQFKGRPVWYNEVSLIQFTLNSFIGIFIFFPPFLFLNLHDFKAFCFALPLSHLKCEKHALHLKKYNFSRLTFLKWVNFTFLIAIYRTFCQVRVLRDKRICLLFAHKW